MPQQEHCSRAASPPLLLVPLHSHTNKFIQIHKLARRWRASQFYVSKFNLIRILCQVSEAGLIHYQQTNSSPSVLHWNEWGVRSSVTTAGMYLRIYAAWVEFKLIWMKYVLVGIWIIQCVIRGVTPCCIIQYCSVQGSVQHRGWNEQTFCCESVQHWAESVPPVSVPSACLHSL